MTEVLQDSVYTPQVRNPKFLKLILNELAAEIASGISATQFLQDVKTLSKKPGTAKTLYELQKEDILNEVNTTVDSMYNEAQIKTKYNAITELINAQQDDTQKAWRPVTGDANHQLLSHNKQILLEKKQSLQSLIQEQRNMKFVLKKQLEQKREHLKILSKQMNIHERKAECI